MKVVVIGGTGLIGSQVVSLLAAQGHEALAAAPNTGVNTLTGEGVAEALTGAAVVVDVSNSPSFADDDVLAFFTTATNTLVAAAKQAGVGHYVALTVVGSARMPDSGYMRAKVAQEKLIAASGLPYSLVHATQFFEFTRAVADGTTVDGEIHLPETAYQPMASAEVAAAVAATATGSPLDGGKDVAGPERFGFADFVARYLADLDDDRKVIADPSAGYFGTKLEHDELVPEGDAEVGSTTYAAWVAAR